MHKIGILVAALVVAAGAAYGQTFTDLAGNQTYEGKTGLKKLATALDANFALLESGATINLSANNITGDGALTWIGAGVTSRLDNAAGKLDGEQIADDTIDDDSLDFADITGADLTLTDCGAVTSSARVQGATLGIGATLTLQLSGTQLLCIVSGVTNVIDADVTTP